MAVWLHGGRVIAELRHALSPTPVKTTRPSLSSPGGTGALLEGKHIARREAESGPLGLMQLPWLRLVAMTSVSGQRQRDEAT